MHRLTETAQRGRQRQDNPTPVPEIHFPAPSSVTSSDPANSRSGKDGLGVHLQHRCPSPGLQSQSYGS